MGFKLALPTPAPGALQRTGAKLRAWWNGEPYDPAAIETPPDRGEPTAADFAEDPARAALVAGEALWGAGRLLPGDETLDLSFGSALGLTKGKRLASFGPDLGARAVLAAQQLQVKTDQFAEEPLLQSAIQETFAGTKKLAKDLSVHLFDGSPGSVPKGKADGVLFYLAAPRPDVAEALAFTAERVLRPGGSGLLFDLFARRNDDPLIEPCRGPEQRQFLDEDAVRAALEAAGLEVRGQEDRGADLLNAWQEATERVRHDFEDFQALLLQTGGQHAAAAALQDIMVWRARADALRAGRLTARRIMFHRPK